MDLHAGRAPAAPSVAIKFMSGAGLAYGDFKFTSPHGQLYSLGFGGYTPTLASGNFVFQNADAPINQYAEQGVWTLTRVDLTDGNYHGSSYLGASLAALFPKLTFNVVNSRSDSAPPTFSTGHILTPIVRTRGTHAAFRANLNVADDRSGVVTVSLTAIDPSGVAYYGGGSLITSPVHAGLVALSIYLSGVRALGTFTISQLLVRDAAGNEVSVTNPSDIAAAFGSSTFTVKN